MLQNSLAAEAAAMSAEGRHASAVLFVGCPTHFSDELAPRVAQGNGKVLAVATGAESLEFVRHHQVGAIVMNVALPDMDARELFTGLRENPQTAAIPVLFLGPGGDSLKTHACLMEADGLIDGDAQPHKVAAWVASRFQQSQETIRASRRDPQTGLPNRAAFCDDYVKACESCRATGETVALAVVAVDDRSAGAEGAVQNGLNAEILPRVASILTASLRATDLVARWSPDEIVVVLPGEDGFGAGRAIEKAMAAWRELAAAPCGGALAGSTISAGLSVVTSETPVASAVADAERYLYKAKAAGGNIVISSQSQLHRRAARALIVIDDRIMSLVIRGLLEKEELKVFHVKDADQAVDACAGRRRFQVMVVDERLPNLDGFTALEKLKHLPRNRQVPTIMLLSQKTDDRVTRALELGANDFEVRPLAPLPFVSRVRKVMARSNATRLPQSQSCRVMIVDDSARELVLAASALHQYGGFCVYLGHGCEDGRNRLASLAVDVLVAPLGMLMGGRLTLTGTVGEATSRDIALVATTGDDRYDPAYLREHGIRGVLKKPFDARTMGRDIEQLVNISAAGKSCDAPLDHLGREIQRVMVMRGTDDTATI